MNKLLMIREKIVAFVLIGAMVVSFAVPAAADTAAKTAASKKQTKEIDTKDSAEDFLEDGAEDLLEEDVEEPLYTAEDLQFMGVIVEGGYRYTWYSERVLPGSGLNIPGRHADENGYVCDEDDFICVASRDFEKGTEIDLPFGKKGKVYDWCGVSGTIDIYVNW